MQKFRANLGTLIVRLGMRVAFGSRTKFTKVTLTKRDVNGNVLSSEALH